MTRQLRAAWQGRRVLGLSDTTPGAFQKHLRNAEMKDVLHHLIGAQVISLGRVGKNVLLGFRGEGGLEFTFQLHFNSTGWLYPLNATAQAQPQDTLYKAFIKFTKEDRPTRFTLDFDDGQEWGYRDLRTWGRIYFWLTADVRNKTAGDLHLYGPDWLYARTTAEQTLFQWNRRSKRPLKEVLLDQRITSGLGNYLSCEICHEARLNPYLPWHNLTGRGLEQVVRACGLKVDEALAAPDYAHWAVFQRKADWCLHPDCRGTIAYRKDTPTSARGSYYCTACQEPAHVDL